LGGLLFMNDINFIKLTEYMCKKNEKVETIDFAITKALAFLEMIQDKPENLLVYPEESFLKFQ